MRGPKRIDEMCEELKKLWELQPDLRLGQLICNTLPEKKLFVIEDDTTLELIKKKREDVEAWKNGSK